MALHWRIFISILGQNEWCPTRRMAMPRQPRTRRELDGVEVGNVELIRLLPRTPGKSLEKNKNIEVVMRVDKRYQSDILTDSTASLVTEGLLGNRYVNITRGITGTPIGDSGVIPGTEE